LDNNPPKGRTDRPAGGSIKDLQDARQLSERGLADRSDIVKANLKLIGAGFGRTGTDSMRSALNYLGFGPCHHMRELIENAHHHQIWRAAVASGSQDWDQLLGGYGSCVDWPTAHYWRELMSAFPQANVLLTWRDPESWWASFERTIRPLLLDDPETEATAPGSQLIKGRVFGYNLEKDHCISVYEENTAAVKALVPPNNLLIYELGDGWEPLCEFLGVGTPQVDFPNRNNTADFQQWAVEQG